MESIKLSAVIVHKTYYYYLRTIVTTASSPSTVTGTHIYVCAATIKTPLTACGCVILHFV